MDAYCLKFVGNRLSLCMKWMRNGGWNIIFHFPAKLSRRRHLTRMESWVNKKCCSDLKNLCQDGQAQRTQEKKGKWHGIPWGKVTSGGTITQWSRLCFQVARSTRGALHGKLQEGLHTSRGGNHKDKASEWIISVSSQPCKAHLRF